MAKNHPLLSRFQEIISHESLSTKLEGEQESISLLYQTDWVRIFVAQQDESSSITIDVEVSKPNLSLSETSPSTKTSEENDKSTRQLLEQFVEHVQYILRLEASGFSIEFVGNDCLILAFQTFTKTPDAEVFELLLPPQTE